MTGEAGRQKHSDVTLDSVGYPALQILQYKDKLQ